MDIVHFTSELAPVGKVGGLGDVIYGLSKALAKEGNRIRIFLPKYDTLDYHLIEDLHVLKENLAIIEEGKEIQNTLWSAKCHSLELILIETHHPKAYFDRGTIYGEEDDRERFLFFCKVAHAALTKPPDIVHLHDWPTAAAALLFKESKVVFTIHCLKHQGRCSPHLLDRLIIPYDKKQMRDPIYPEEINLLKGALYNSDAIVAVSPTYTEEIQTSEGSCGLEEDLFANKKKLLGILNGIDDHYWNPETDPFLTRPYNAETAALGKKENKNHIQKHLGLEQSDSRLLVVSVTRLVPQKGLDLLQYGVEKTLALGGQFVLLGSTADPEIQEQFTTLQEQYKEDPNVAIRLEYDEPLSHLLFAGSDLFLMPSIFEPCGLTQMIALRYGSIPLVRSTGGLKDTVFDPEDSDKPNGFAFLVPDNKGVASVLERAFALSQEHPEKWQTLMQNGMRADVSWDSSAKKYLELFNKLLS